MKDVKNMKYPRLSPWVKISETDTGGFILEDEMSKETFTLSYDEARLALRLNGRNDPKKIRTDMSDEDRDEFLEAMDGLMLTRKSRVLLASFSDILITVWYARISKGFRVASKIINALLAACWLPVLLLGAFLVMKSEPDYLDMNILISMYAGLFAGTLSGIVLHEFGHMVACLAYGGKVYEAGIMLKFIVIPAAYVFMNHDCVRSRMKRVQINAAGIEMNFLLTGISLIAAVIFPGVAFGFFIGSALANVTLGLMNLILVSSLDGMQIIGELLGIENLCDKAKKVLLNSRLRKRKLGKGISGAAEVAMCGMVCAAQIAMPVLVIFNIMGVVLWFV